MQEILFPSQYKSALVNKTKSSTVRVDKERGKYVVGKIYCAKSYAGTDWKIKIKILEVIPTTVKQLYNYGLTKMNLKPLLKDPNVSVNTKVELIKFKVL